MQTPQAPPKVTVPIQCPKCKNDDPYMMDTYGHRREQVSCSCHVCAHSWVHVFKEVPKENIIPKEVLEKLNGDQT